MAVGSPESAYFGDVKYLGQFAIKIPSIAFKT